MAIFGICKPMQPTWLVKLIDLGIPYASETLFATSIATLSTQRILSFKLVLFVVQEGQ